MKKTWTWLRKINVRRETESLLIAAQNNAISINYAKARIDKTQQNRKCRLRGDRDETINHIISECSKFAQKDNQTTLHRMGKVIHGKLCKKFYQTNKWCMLKSESVPENVTQKFSCNFEIKMDHLISV